MQSEYTGDAQLINSVYLDNDSLEVYHGRLDQRPASMAVRISWHGPQEPHEVLVERKIRKNSVKNEGDIKDSFMLPEDAVVAFLEGLYTSEQALSYWKSQVGLLIIMKCLTFQKQPKCKNNALL